MSDDLTSSLSDRMAGQSVLVTGGSGFIGRRLVSRLLGAGASVTILQRPDSSVRSDCDVVTADLGATDASAQIASALKGRRFDAIFNLAAYGVTRSPDRSPEALIRERAMARRVNVEAAEALALHARHSRSGVFVQAGTCSEYAPPAARIPSSESDPVERRDDDSVIYGASKASATETLLAAAAGSDLSLVVARIFNVYGPGEQSQRLFPALVKHLNAGKHMCLSAGQQVKDYLYLDDVVEGLYAFAVAATEQSFKGVINLSSGQPVTVAQFARAVANAIDGREHLLGFGERPTHPDEVGFLVGSTAIRDMFTNWRPRTSLDIGLPRAIQHMVASTDD